MRKEELTQLQYTKILDSFVRALMQNGLKATTMDAVASSLQMSKRTLYELFGSKEQMFREAHLFFHRKIRSRLAEIFADSSNIMEAIVKCFLFNRDIMSRLNADFIRDMEEYASHEDSETDKRQNYQNLYDVLEKGVKEGYFRKDLNLRVQCRIFAIQTESLKRAELLFPDDISLIEIFDNVIIGFLRAISTPRGLKELDKYLPSFSNISSNADFIDETIL